MIKCSDDGYGGNFLRPSVGAVSLPLHRFQATNPLNISGKIEVNKLSSRKCSLQAISQCVCYLGLQTILICFVKRKTIQMPC